MEKQREFFKLLRYSNELKKNKESLYERDYEAFKLLLEVSVAIENNYHYSEKQEYVELANNFLADQINSDDFSYSFMAIYEGINKKIAKMKRIESVELANFLKPNRPKLGRLLARIYGSCDSFSPNPEIAMANEKELKDCAQILLLKLQEE